MADVRSLGNGWFAFDDGGRQRQFAIARDAKDMWVFLDGQVYTIANHEGTGRAARQRGGGDVMAPMPATVVAIHAAPGQRVSEGDTLIVLEAMKMELPIKSPRSGTVTAVKCARGDLVQPGVNLLEIE